MRRRLCEDKDIGKTPYEDGGRDWSDAATGQGVPRRTSSHQKLGEEPGTDPSSRPSEGTNPADPLTLDFWPLEL